MYYCQDCGGANAANATSCRICGHPLARERVGAPCQSCGAPTVAGANFCSLCGTATVAVPAASLAGVLPGSLKVDAAIVDERQAATARLGSTVNLSEGLDLPDWLKRAAAEQPFDPKHQTAVAANPFGPAGGAATTLTAPPPTNGSGASVTDLGSHPPLSIPLAGPAGASSQGSAPAADALVASDRRPRDRQTLPTRRRSFPKTISRSGSGNWPRPTRRRRPRSCAGPRRPLWRRDRRRLPTIRGDVARCRARRHRAGRRRILG